jgi:hypothetical protein
MDRLDQYDLFRKGWYAGIADERAVWIRIVRDIFNHYPASVWPKDGETQPDCAAAFMARQTCRNILHEYKKRD